MTPPSWFPVLRWQHTAGPLRREVSRFTGFPHMAEYGIVTRVTGNSAIFFRVRDGAAPETGRRGVEAAMLGSRSLGRHRVSNETGTPCVGMLATVRNRRRTVVSVDEFDTTPDGRLHLVRGEDTDRVGHDSGSVVWEREHASTLLQPNALPLVRAEVPMMPSD